MSAQRTSPAYWPAFVDPLIASMTPGSVPITIVILALNEEANLGPCIDSCAFSDDIHVLDSGSTDRSVEVAEAHGAKVWTNTFESFAAQRNWAIDNVPHKYHWVFHLDADERFTPGLVAEMRRIIDLERLEAGWYVPNRLIFMGRWLKFASGYPVYQVRLFHRERLRFQVHGHSQRELTEGVVGKLDEPYLHFNFSKGLEDWFDKHNRYSSQEAQQAFDERGRGAGSAGVFSSDRTTRRRALKSLAYRFPMRPTLRWLYTMVMQRAMLDGPAGWRYARLLAMYEKMTDLKLKELRLVQRHQS
jgi:glycosyltransferase involved in cell wall biosynthesis